MPEDDKSPNRPIAAAKTPPNSEKTGPVRTKSAEREARLSEALRENLRRRKTGGQSSGKEASGEELPGAEVKDD